MLSTLPFWFVSRIVFFKAVSTVSFHGQLFLYCNIRLCLKFQVYCTLNSQPEHKWVENLIISPSRIHWSFLLWQFQPSTKCRLIRSSYLFTTRQILYCNTQRFVKRPKVPSTQCPVGDQPQFVAVPVSRRTNVFTSSKIKESGQLAHCDYRSKM